MFAIDVFVADKFPLKQVVGFMTQSGQEALSSTNIEVKIEIGSEKQTAYCEAGHGIIVVPPPGVADATDAFMIEQAFGRDWSGR